jgi:hypothetical protein
MAVQQTATTSFKVQLLQAVHNFGPTTPNTFKIALYTAAANIGPTTTTYTGTSGEVSGTGYTAGGNTLVISVSPHQVIILVTYLLRLFRLTTQLGQMPRLLAVAL